MFGSKEDGAYLEAGGDREKASAMGAKLSESGGRSNGAEAEGDAAYIDRQLRPGESALSPEAHNRSPKR